MTVIDICDRPTAQGSGRSTAPQPGAMLGVSTTMPVETPAIALACEIRDLASVVAIAKTLEPERTVVLVVVSDTSPSAVRPIYDAEARVLDRFPKARFEVRVSRADRGWDPARMQQPTRVLLLRA